MSDIDINQVLAQMRVMAAKAQGGVEPQAVSGAEQSDFSQLLKQSVNAVNETQKHAGKLTEQFQAGDPNTDLTQVVVALEKSSVAFEAMKQVRNKLVDAYQEIMRMSI